VQAASCAVCAAGQFSRGASTPCALCSPGTYSALGSGNCTLCPPGQYGDRSGLPNATCSGPCTAGHTCLGGSLTPTEVPCPPGQFSLAGAWACSPCPPGRYGSESAAPTANCLGPCDPGRFGAVGGFFQSQCQGPCSAGWSCVAGSTSSQEAPCTPGQYSLQAASSCVACPGGKYGGTPRLTSPECSGNCTAGYFCPLGSVNATSPAQECPAGSYSSAGAATCAPCAAGQHGAAPVMVLANCTGPCTAGHFCPAGSDRPDAFPCPAGWYSLPGAAACSQCGAGRFGNTSRQSSADCSGDCTAGYFCVAGSVNATAAPCPAGQFSFAAAGTCTNCSLGSYGAHAALTTPGCTGLCPAGTYGAVPGLAVATCSGACAAGYACVAGSTNATAAVCPVGRFSIGGAGDCTACRAGRYGAVPAMPAPDCTGNCSAGYFCTAGSSSAAPAACPPGQYSQEGRGECSPCPIGRYGLASAEGNVSCTAACPGGVYGGVEGLSTADCSGNCSAGYACAPGSVNATAAVCAPGRFSLTGAAVCSSCPAGRYGSSAGLRNAACSGECTAGGYCLPGSWSIVRARPRRFARARVRAPPAPGNKFMLYAHAHAAHVPPVCHPANVFGEVTVRPAAGLLPPLVRLADAVRCWEVVQRHWAGGALHQRLPGWVRVRGGVVHGHAAGVWRAAVLLPHRVLHSVPGRVGKLLRGWSVAAHTRRASALSRPRCPHRRRQGVVLPGGRGAVPLPSGRVRV
jgi:hypothetical protein